MSMDAEQLDKWLDWVESWVPRVGKIAAELPEALQPVFFEAVLDHILSGPIPAGEGRPDSTTPPRGTQPPSATPAQPSAMRPERWHAFTKEFSISISDVEKLVNSNTGEILVRNLARRGSEVQRRVAALTALWKCSQGQEMTVTTDEIMKESKRFGVDDSANLAANLRRTQWKGLAVFTFEGGEWKVTRNGEEFVADIVKGLVGAPEST